MAKGVKGSSPVNEGKAMRTSFNILPTTMKKVRYIALMESTDLTKIIESSLQDVIAKYEKKNGTIPVK